MVEMSKLSQEILKQLDDRAEEFAFPILDNGYVYPADTRLSVYANQPHWAIIVEVLGYAPRAWKTDGFDNCLYCFGNFLAIRPDNKNMHFLFPISDGSTAPLFADDEPEVINPLANEVKLRDTLISITRDPAIYLQNGIVLANPPSIQAFEFLRLLCIAHRESLLAKENELQERLNGDLPLLLRVNEWHHPDIIRDEKPSQNETFVLIAEAIDKLDPSIYHPSELPNTHWSNWPGGGTL